MLVRTMFRIFSYDNLRRPITVPVDPKYMNARELSYSQESESTNTLVVVNENEGNILVDNRRIRIGVYPDE